MKTGQPVGKIARRLGVAPTLKAAKILERRPNPPGQHGARRKSQKSIYGEQLIEKQKLRFQFMISEKALKRTFMKARNTKGNTGDNFLRALDERLDATIFRAGLLRSMPAARQMVSHNHVYVNGKRVNIPSYRVKVGDVISFSDKAKGFTVLAETLKESHSVPYIEINRDNGTLKRIANPDRASIPVICNEAMVVEYYSR